MKLLIIFCFLVSYSTSLAQSIVVKGKVVVEETQKPLPLAYVGFPNTDLETSTNDKGEFVLKVPKEYAEKKLQIRRNGYETKDIVSQEWNAAKKLKIQLSIETQAEAEKKALEETNKMIENLPKSNIEIGEVGKFHLVFYRNPIKHEHKKYYNNLEAIIKTYWVVPDMKKEKDSCVLIFSYWDLPDSYIMEKQEDLWQNLIKEIEDDKDLFDIVFKSKNTSKHKNYQLLELLFEANPNNEEYKQLGSFQANIYIFIVKKRIYKFLFVNNNGNITKEEVYFHLNKFKILE